MTLSLPLPVTTLQKDTLTELHRDPFVTFQIEARMRDPEFSTGGMITPDLDMLEAMEKDAYYLRQNNFDKIQILSRVFLLHTLAKAFGKRINWNCASPTHLRNKQIGCVDPRLPRVTGAPLQTPIHPHWTIASNPVFAILGGKFQVEIVTWTSTQQCPFDIIQDRLGKRCSRGFRDLHIHNMHLNKGVVLSETAVHMAGQHGYFEKSLNGHYNLDVANLIEVLDIKPGQNYDTINKVIHVPIRPLLQKKKAVTEKKEDETHETPFFTMEDLLVDSDTEPEEPTPLNPPSVSQPTYRPVLVVDVERTYTKFFI